MSELLSCNIIERHKNGDFIWSWTFPCILQEQKDAVEKKYFFPNVKNYLYGRWKELWFYINLMEYDSSLLKDIVLVGVVIWTKEFNPDKYKPLTSLLCKTFNDSGDPTKVLQIYLSAYTKEIDSNENGSILFKEYCLGANFSNSKIKEMINTFGLEIIVVYNALLLKRKLMVYHHNLPTLLEWLTTFTHLMIHRKFDQVFFPWIELNDGEIEELNSSPSYIAGCCDNTIFSRPELYDVLVNLPAKEITVAPHCKDQLAMTKLHKDVALFMEQLGNNEAINENIVNAIAGRTQEIIARLKSLATSSEDGNYELPLSSLKKNNISLPMENFLLQLASSEGIQITRD